MERKDILKRLSEIEEEHKKLYSEYEELQRENILLCDESQWFTEVEEEIVVKHRPKTVEKKLIGRKHWRETFVDESTGEDVSITRSQIVRVNGEWI